MAFEHGRNTYFSLDDAGGVERNLTTVTDSVSGLPGAKGLSEVTAFGAGGVANIPSLENVTFSASGSYDSTAVTGPGAVLASVRGAAAPVTFVYGPAGNAAGKPRFTGVCWLTGFTIDASVAEKVPWSGEFQVDGVVTIDVFPA